MSSIAKYYLSFFSLLTFSSIAQVVELQIVEDTLYREDQFYIGVTYNIISSLSSGFVEPIDLSGGIQFGYLRDMPINEQRNLAVAVGVGFSLDQYSQNIFINKDVNGITTFTILDDTTTFNTNRLNITSIEVPIEFRWRSSTPSTYKFWRVYAGFRFGYAIWNKSTFKQSGNSVSISDIPEFDKLRLGATLSFGYSTFNFFAYYSINPFFNDNAVSMDGQRVNFKTLNLGLIFYIL